MDIQSVFLGKSDFSREEALDWCHSHEYDCDKIDAFGEIGVYRHVLFMSSGRMKVEDVVPKCEKRWAGLMLEETRKLAKRDYEYIVNFFNTLKEELDTSR